jgi:DNA (cytosine-5)-methyltransferase 1
VDERHLWPAWFDLIARCRPAVVFGEQVEAAIEHGWLDLVHDDLEGIGYAVAPVGLPAACVGAPHIRQRAYWVAESLHADRRPVDGGYQPDGRDGAHGGREETYSESGTCGEVCILADDNAAGRGLEWVGSTADRHASSGHDVDGSGAPGMLANAWADAEWIACRDGKYRPVKSCLQPLAHGVPGRVGLLRGAGNAIVPQVAAEFIKAYLGTELP